MRKAVLDTNVVVSGMIREAGPPGQILRLVFAEQKFTAVTSLQILAALLHEDLSKQLVPSSQPA